MARTASPIDRVIERAKSEGNSIAAISEGWERVRQVTHMSADISDNLWSEVQRNEPTLRCWASDATPHSQAERGFTDDALGLAVSFPRK